jgi:transcriptional regulator with XRE-family HTH domain
MDLKESIGARLKEIRGKKGITQEKLSEAIGISSKYLSSIERGKENPTLNTLIRLSTALSIEFEELFSSLYIEDPENRKDRILNLLENADQDQLKTIEKVCKVLIT